MHICNLSYCFRNTCKLSFNSLPANGDFGLSVIIFANRLDQDQTGQSVGPDLDPNCLTL